MSAAVHPLASTCTAEEHEQRRELVRTQGALDGRVQYDENGDPALVLFQCRCGTGLAVLATRRVLAASLVLAQEARRGR